MTKGELKMERLTMAEIIHLKALTLPDCERCKDLSKRILSRTMDLEGPGITGVIYKCDNKRCRQRRDAVARFILRIERTDNG